MIKREVICDRCGKVIAAPHPDRITVSQQHYEEYTDCFGRKHKKSTYKTAKTLHFCDECNKEFEAFLNPALTIVTTPLSGEALKDFEGDYWKAVRGEG